MHSSLQGLAQILYIKLNKFYLQVIEIVLPTFNAPQWIAQTIIFVVIMGFPIALLIAWASEIRKNKSLCMETNDLRPAKNSCTESPIMWLYPPKLRATFMRMYVVPALFGMSLDWLWEQLLCIFTSFQLCWAVLSYWSMAARMALRWLLEVHFELFWAPVAGMALR